MTYSPSFFCPVFRGKSFFARLFTSRCASRGLVIPSVAQVLGLREGENISPLERLKEELRQKQMLLLLDNFEQVIDAAAQVADLLASCLQLTSGSGPSPQTGLWDEAWQRRTPCKARMIVKSSDHNRLYSFLKYHHSPYPI